MVVTLADMSEAEFRRRRAGLVADTAAAVARAEGRHVQEAEAEAERSVAENLPQGPRTPGQLVRKAVVDGQEVGWIWVSLPGSMVPAMAWISEVTVDAGFRRRGFGAAIVTAAERELTERGIPRVGLNVFGGNAGARRLYERLGYAITHQQRCRALVDIPSAEGVELVPMRDYAERMGALVADYAGDLQEEEQLSPYEAKVLAEHRLAEWLPAGAATEGAILRTVWAGGAEVGWVWAGLPSRPRPGMGWLHNIAIDAPYQSRGYGSSVIAAMQHEFLHRGLRSMGLNVHGCNVRAQALYERLGFEVMAQQMAKGLSPG
ncbi:GNAT family N-acetyltransferase [Actinoplanes sp. N902-109]|uniref:GNAT family N-acetyltransferase n=1 Tax=Actinoplanes sp. (strain N902-109) TaxID=649831 RepID=UPI0003296476|nr:GNAT family N-acetyltransferase [Actinoplanes sp. N902-109]AGL20033.1 GCN5-like N-acetyltransferase [Actinoplanes sp. N902-109]